MPTPTPNQILAKIQELRDNRIYNDDDCFDGSNTNCKTELRAILSATSIDDTLAAVDAYRAKLHAQIIEDAKLWDEAEDALMGFRESATKMFERENALYFYGLIGKRK